MFHGEIRLGFTDLTSSYGTLYLRYCRTGVVFHSRVYAKDQYVTTCDDVKLVKPNRIREVLQYSRRFRNVRVILRRFDIMIITRQRCVSGTPQYLVLNTASIRSTVWHTPSRVLPCTVLSIMTCVIYVTCDITVQLRCIRYRYGQAARRRYRSDTLPNKHKSRISEASTLITHARETLRWLYT